MVSEFKKTEVVKGCSPAEIDKFKCWQKGAKGDIQMWGKSWPPGSKVVRVDKRVEKPGGQKEEEKQDATIGTPWSEDEFVLEALNQLHPQDREIQLQNDVAEVLFREATAGIGGTSSKRLATLEYYRKTAKELDKQEKALHRKINEILLMQIDKLHTKFTR